MATVDDKGFKS